MMGNPVQLELLCVEDRVAVVLSLPSPPASPEAACRSPTRLLLEHSTSGRADRATATEALNGSVDRAGASQTTLESLRLSVCQLAELLQNQATSSRGQAGQPASVPGTPRAALTSAAVDKLLTLELEVVQLQQSLQIAQLDYETHTVQLQSLAQRVQEAECRAQAAQERASSMAQQIQEAEVQCSSLQQENAALRAQLEASGGQRKQQQQTDVQEQLAGIRAGLEAAQAECGRLRKQTAKVRPLEAECAQLQRAVSVHSAHASEARERLSRVRQENRQLRAQIGDACGALKALGIPVHQVFSRTALANANTAAAAPSHLVSPAKPGTTSGTHAEAAPGPEGSQAQRVPRLQLSAISLEQLQQRASLQQQPADIHGVQRDECAAPCGEQSAEHAHPLTAVPAADQTQQVAGPGGAAAATKSQGRGPPGKPQALAAGPWPTAPPPVLIPASPAFQSLTSEQWQTAKAHMSLESPTWQSVNSGLSGGAKWQTTMSEAATALSPGINGAIPAHRPLPPDPAHIQQAGMLQQLVRQPAKGVHPAEVVAAQPDTARSHGGAAHARMQQQQQQLFVAAPPAARGARPASAAGGTPILRYGQLPAFHEVRQAYQAVMAAGATGDRTAKFVNSLLSSSSAVETNPRKVEPVIEALLQLFHDNGVVLPIRKTGPCQYQLGQVRIVVRLVNGRLMTRSGPTNVDVLDWLERHPVVQQQQTAQAR